MLIKKEYEMMQKMQYLAHPCSVDTRYNSGKYKIHFAFNGQLFAGSLILAAHFIVKKCRNN